MNNFRRVVLLGGLVVFLGWPLTSSAAGLPGEEVYQGTCIACHGEDGQGAFSGIPDFTVKDGRLSQEDEVLVRHITEGFESPGSFMAMPPNGGNEDLTKEDVVNVIAYIRETFGVK